MMISPDIEKVYEIAATGKYNVLPVSMGMLSDSITPIEAMRILKNVSTHCYMLESVAGHEKWGRYTFLGYDPKIEITCVNGVMKAGNITVKTNDPSSVLRQILSDYKSPRFDHLPLPADWSDIFPTIISGTANRRSKRTPKIQKTLRMSI